MKYKLFQTNPLIFSLFFFIFAGDFCLYKTFAYADEAFHPAMTGKMDPIGFALDDEKPASKNNKTQKDIPKTDADRLLNDLVNRKKTQTTEKKWFKWFEKPDNEVKIEVKKELDRMEREKAQKEKQKREREKKAGDENPFWFWPGSGYQEPGLSEGQAAYKVAVSDKKVTLKEAVAIAIANNVQLQALKKKVEAADSKLTEAKRALFPTLQIVKEINGGHVSGRFYKGENEKINISQPLFYGGELQFTVKQAEENLNSIRSEYEKSKGELVHQVRTAYYGVVKAEYNHRYQAELYDNVRTIRKRSQEEFRQKLLPEIDFLNVESEYQQVFFQVESSKNDLLSADLLLHQSIRLDSAEPLPINLEVGFKKVEPDFKKMLELALANNPDIQAKEYERAAAKYGVKIYQAKKMPRVDLRGSYGYLGEAFHDTQAFTTDHKADNDLEKEWFLGIETSMPLGPNSVEYSQVKHTYGPTVLALTGSDDWRHHIAFNLMDKFSNITDEKTAQAALLQAESDYEKARNDVTLRIRDDFYNLQKFLIQIDSSEARIKYQGRQNQILDYMRGLQETSAAGLVEGFITQAQNKFSFIQAVTDYELAKSSLSVSIGDSDYFEDKS